jgi:hypothetical protein
MRIILLLVILVAGFSGKALAERACTEIGCMNGLMLNIDPDYEWKWGFYEFTFLMEGRSVSCKGQLPLKKCEDGPSFRCSSDVIQIGESGCALPESAHGISMIQVNDTPRRMMVRVKRGGVDVITRTLTPEYQESKPNGPGCGPVCTSASYNLLTAD